MNTRVVFCLAAGTICAAVGQILFKVGATGRETIASYVNLWIVTGFLAYAIGTMLWIYALSKAYLTTVYPFTALTFVFVYLFGVFVFDEPTTLKALAGVALILGGLFLISTG